LLDLINKSYATGSDNNSNIAGKYLLGFILILSINSAKEETLAIIASVYADKFLSMLFFILSNITVSEAFTLSAKFLSFPII